jgi:hypothetical protein
MLAAAEMNRTDRRDSVRTPPGTGQAVIRMKIFNQKQQAIGLIVLGATPFVVLTMLVVFPINSVQLPATPALMLHIYAVIIASFVAGLHWGIHFCKRTNDSVYLASSFIAILLLLSMGVAGTAGGLALVLLGFMLLWLQEYRLSVQRVTTVWFWQVRHWISALVSACLALATFFV